jgi:hypothetical protein
VNEQATANNKSIEDLIKELTLSGHLSENDVVEPFKEVKYKTQEKLQQLGGDVSTITVASLARY